MECLKCRGTTGELKWYVFSKREVQDRGNLAQEEKKWIETI